MPEPVAAEGPAPRPIPMVTVEPVGPHHAAAMLRWMQDPEVAANLGLRGEPSAERTEDWIRRSTADPAIRAYAVLVDGRHVGNVVLDRIDGWLGTARLSVYMGEPDARNRGIGQAGIRAVLAEAFGPLRLHKVWLVVHVRNARAIAAYLRIGFRIEGVLRDEFLLAGQRLDVFAMGLLASEFARPPAG